MDTKTGFIYATMEETETRTGLTSGWLVDSARESCTKETERAAFEKLLNSFESSWNRVYGKYSGR
jgi:hypothetical protein